ncbi:hypothetical protein ACFE04_028753 [Oxalis oulophora]
MLNNSKRVVHARPPFRGRKDSNPEDLTLFKELHKRDKFDGMASLLQPVSDEFEPSASGTGNPSFYRIASGKKGFGYDFFGETGKNDYDWLKTPPATPLFTSIEMEGNAPELVVQREIPIIHPLSRFAGNNSETMKGNNNERTKSPIPKQKIPERSVTPNQPRSINSFPSTEPKTTTMKPPFSYSSIDRQTKNNMTQAITKQKIIATTEYLNPNAINKRTNQSIIGSTKSTNQCRKDDQFLFSNISRNTADSKIKQRNRSNVSPFASRPAFEGFSNEAPPNLRTSERSTSATRRSTTSNQKMTAAQKPEAKPIIRRQSCSPSVTRGRNIMESNNNKFEEEIVDGKVLRCNQKGHHVLGSRMVDKVMNARKLSSSYGNYVQERDQTKPKYVQK